MFKDDPTNQSFLQGLVAKRVFFGTIYTVSIQFLSGIFLVIFKM